MYNRINRREAYAKLCQGTAIYMLPSKTSMFSLWLKPHELTAPMEEKEFIKLITEYQHYNCCPELGSTVNFYEEILDK